MSLLQVVGLTVPMDSRGDDSEARVREEEEVAMECLQRARGKGTWNMDGMDERLLERALEEGDAPRY